MTNELATETPGIGHNKPRQIDLVRDKAEAVAREANAWLKKVPGKIPDKHTAAEADNYLSQVTSWLTSLDAQRLAETKDLRAEVKAINDSYGPTVSLLLSAKALIGPKAAEWLAREDARRAAEKRQQQIEATRLAREAEEAARKAQAGTGDIVGNTAAAAALAETAARAQQEAARPVERAQVRGSYSSRARSLRVLWHAEVDDVVMAFSHYQEHPKVIEVLTELASADARVSSGKVEIPGCRVLSREIAA